MLVLDAGNALFKSRDSGMAPDARPRAELLLAQMDAQGTTAMAVGARDLVLGVDFLRKQTRKSKLKLLSANLVDGQGKLLFPASVVTEVGGLKVGVVGVSPATPEPLPMEPQATGKAAGSTMRGLPLQPAIAAEVKRLREQSKVDLVLLLAAAPYVDVVQVADSVEGVDFVVQSHEGRGSGIAQRQGLTTVVPPGDRGRQLARLELSVDGPGRFVDNSEPLRAKENLRIVEMSLSKARERLQSTTDAAGKRALTEAVASLEARRTALEKTAGQGATQAPRTHLLSYIQLGADVPADPVVQKSVERVEPPGSAAH
ncbi:5'-nucleotidase [Myxococcus sp. K15C18031901]|uniref:5'-nucleotidase n=1 Tax=Myxococcus dinghuensis TaxID=2906761 RepID=UPI0020A6DE9E|nr:5'-nucleotidase [Myxococcus dinghuensis]MCP3099934.1 5'-nucleotidase [Myxococcus dinghuensis]